MRDEEPSAARIEECQQPTSVGRSQVACVAEVTPALIPGESRLLRNVGPEDLGMVKGIVIVARPQLPPILPLVRSLPRIHSLSAGPTCRPLGRHEKLVLEMAGNHWIAPYQTRPSVFAWQ